MHFESHLLGQLLLHESFIGYGVIPDAKYEKSTKMINTLDLDMSIFYQELAPYLHFESHLLGQLLLHESFG